MLVRCLLTSALAAGADAAAGEGPAQRQAVLQCTLLCVVLWPAHKGATSLWHALPCASAARAGQDQRQRERSVISLLMILNVPFWLPALCSAAQAGQDQRQRERADGGGPQGVPHRPQVRHTQVGCAPKLWLACFGLHSRSAVLPAALRREDGARAPASPLSRIPVAHCTAAVDMHSHTHSSTSLSDSPASALCQLQTPRSATSRRRGCC